MVARSSAGRDVDKHPAIHASSSLCSSSSSRWSSSLASAKMSAKAPVNALSLTSPSTSMKDITKPVKKCIKLEEQISDFKTSMDAIDNKQQIQVLQLKMKSAKYHLHSQKQQYQHEQMMQQLKNDELMKRMQCMQMELQYRQMSNSALFMNLFMNTSSTASPSISSPAMGSVSTSVSASSGLSSIPVPAVSSTSTVGMGPSLSSSSHSSALPSGLSTNFPAMMPMNFPTVPNLFGMNSYFASQMGAGMMPFILQPMMNAMPGFPIHANMMPFSTQLPSSLVSLPPAFDASGNSINATTSDIASPAAPDVGTMTGLGEGDSDLGM